MTYSNASLAILYRSYGLDVTSKFSSLSSGSVSFSLLTIPNTIEIVFLNNLFENVVDKLTNPFATLSSLIPYLLI